MKVGVNEHIIDFEGNPSGGFSVVDNMRYQYFKIHIDKGQGILHEELEIRLSK